MPSTPPLTIARMDRATLNAMLGAMKDSFPMFRKYFKHKAKLIGKEKLAWWDISAPMGKTDKVYSFEEARDFIVENFNKFSPELGAFAKRAFDNNWIDAEQRDGKRGGAFCMGVAGRKGKPHPLPTSTARSTRSARWRMNWVTPSTMNVPIRQARPNCNKPRR